MSRKTARTRRTVALVKQNPAYAAMVSYTDTPQPVMMPRNYKAFAQQGYRTSDTVYKCISYISRNGAAIEPVLYTDRTMQDTIDEHPLLDKLRNPNPEQSGVDFRESLLGFLHLSGNAYTYAIKPKNGLPDELWSLRPDYVEPQIAKNRGVIRYKYQGMDDPISPDQIGHLKFWSPDDDTLGLAPTEVASLNIDQQTGAKKWNLALLQNGARMSGAWVTSATLAKNDRDRLEGKLNEKFSGPKNAGRIPVLDGGLTWQGMSIPPAQMDWLDGLKYHGGSIANIYNLAPQLIGDTSASTFDNYEQAKQASYTEAIFPALDKMYALWNLWLMPMYIATNQNDFRLPPTAYLYYNKETVEVIQKLIQAQKTAQTQRAIDIWTNGLGTQNEGRELAGLPSTPQGNVFRIGAILVPADKIEDYAIQSMTKPAAPPVPAAEPILPTPENDQNTDDNPPSNPANDADTDTTSKRYPRVSERKALDLQTAEQKKAYADSFESARERWYGKAEHRLQDYFKSEKSAVLAAINNAAIPSSADIRANQALQTKQSDLQNVLMGIYQDVGADIGKATLKELKSSSGARARKDDAQEFIDLFGPDNLTYLLQVAGQKITQISGTTQAQIQSELADGVAAGESIPELAKRIDNLYLEQIIPNRSTVIARTEVIGASNYASVQAAKQSGLNLNKLWLATDDARTRPDHAAADGQEVGMDDPFEVGGEELQYPGDPSGSAGNVINCRCTTTYKRVQASADDSEDDAEEEAQEEAEEQEEEETPFNPVSESEAEAGLSEVAQEWQKELSTDQIEAINYYTGPGYGQMNKYLRDGASISKDLLQTIKDAEAGLMKAIAPFDFLAYRCVPAKIMQEYAGSQFFQDKGFSSTSIEPQSGFGDFQIDIQVRKGAPGGYVGAGISDFDNEKEFLIPPGAVFKILELDLKNNTAIFEYNGKYEVEAEIKRRIWGMERKDISPDRLDKFTWQSGDLVPVKVKLKDQKSKKSARGQRKAAYKTFMEKINDATENK